MSFIEAWTNIFVGFGISMLAIQIVAPFIGVTINLEQNFNLAMIMTAVSLARSYTLRRIFESIAAHHR